MNGVLTRALRTAARAMTGTTYAVLGADAYRMPGGRVDTAGPLLESVRQAVPLPEDDELLVKVNGAAQVVAGTALALGKLPRLASVVLVGSMVPTTLAGHAYWEHDDPAKRSAQRIQFLKNLAMIGGLLLVSLDESNARRLRRQRG